MSKTYQDLMTEDRRLVLLRLLSEAEGYTINEYVLSAALPGLGHSASADRIRTDLGWLAEQGLVEVESPAGVRLARLTARGADVAVGRARVEGVKRPLPGE